MARKRWLLCALSVGLALGQARDVGAQAPPPVAELRFDVNGDGTPDLVRLENPAAVSVSLGRGGKVDAWMSFTAPGTLAGGRLSKGVGKQYPGGPVILAEAQFHSPGPGSGAKRTEALLLQWRGSKLHQLWRGDVGLQGPDREWSTHLTTSAHGVLRYQGKPGLERCDGEPVYAFLERWDWQGKRFRAVKGNLVRVRSDASVMRAKREPDATAPTAPVVFRRAIASSIEGASSARELVPPRAILDGRADTAWREGAPAHGRGEVITFRSAMSSSRVAALRFLPGDTASDAAFKSHNRLRRFAVLIGSSAHWIELARDPASDLGARTAPYWVRFEPPIAASCVSIVLDDVYPASTTGKTAIAEMSVFTAAELTPGGLYPMLAERVAAGGLAGDSAIKTLARGGAQAAAALLAAVAAPARKPVETQRLRLAMTELDAPSLIAELVAGLADGGADADLRDRFRTGLARFGVAAVAPLSAVLAASGTAREAAIAAVDALGAIDAKAATNALLQHADHRSKRVRRAVGLVLGRRQVLSGEVLTRALETRSQKAQGTIWRALGAIALRSTDSRLREEIAAMAQVALASASENEYELRYRLFDAAGAMPSAKVTAALADALARETDSSSGPALKRVAARALSLNRSPEAARLLTTLLSDPDPGVRGRSARALAERDHRASDAPLITQLSADRWPKVRLSAAAALGQRCTRTAPARALFDAVDRDLDARVRLVALAGLVNCEAKGIAARLIVIAKDRKRDPDLRARACTYYAAHGRAGAGGRSAAERAPKLIEIFRQARNEALGGNSHAPRIAAACAVAMSTTDAAKVLPLLLSAAQDAAFPGLQAAAATGLGNLCGPRARRLLGALRGSPQRQVSVAARAAYRRCYR